MALLYFLNFGKDPSLTAAGIMQCQNFPHHWLFGVSGLKVLSSPFRRCKETIGKLTDLPFQIEPLVREISGSSEDRYANVQDPFLWADRGIFCYESREHARYRVCQFLATKEEGGLYFVMTHKWFIYEVLSFFKLKPFMTGNLEGVFLEFPANQSAGRLPKQIKRYPFFKVLAKRGDLLGFDHRSCLVCFSPCVPLNMTSAAAPPVHALAFSTNLSAVF